MSTCLRGPSAAGASSAPAQGPSPSCPQTQEPKPPAPPPLDAGVWAPSPSSPDPAASFLEFLPSWTPRGLTCTIPLPTRCVLPWAEFESLLCTCHPVEPGSTALALRSTIDLTCSGHVSIFEFDIFTRLFQVREGQGGGPGSCPEGGGGWDPDSWLRGRRGWGLRIQVRGRRAGGLDSWVWGRIGWRPLCKRPLRPTAGVSEAVGFLDPRKQWESGCFLSPSVTQASLYSSHGQHSSRTGSS